MDTVLDRLVDEPDLITRIRERGGARTPEEAAALEAYEPYPHWRRLLDSLRKCAMEHGVPVGTPPHVPQEIGAIASKAGVEWRDRERGRFTEYLLRNLGRILGWILLRLRAHVHWNGGDREAIRADDAEREFLSFLAPDTEGYRARRHIASITAKRANERTPAETRTLRLFDALVGRVSVDDFCAVGSEILRRHGLPRDRRDRAAACINEPAAGPLFARVSERADEIASTWSENDTVAFTERFTRRDLHDLRVLILASLSVYVDRYADSAGGVQDVNAEDAWNDFFPIGVKACGGDFERTSLDRLIDWYRPQRAPEQTCAFVNWLNDRFEAQQRGVLTGQIMGGYLWALLLARIRGTVYPQLDSHCLSAARRIARRQRDQDFPTLLPLQDDQLSAPEKNGDGDLTLHPDAGPVDGGGDLTLHPDAGTQDRGRQSEALQSYRDAIRGAGRPVLADGLETLSEEQQLAFLSCCFGICHRDIAGTVTAMRRIDWEKAGGPGNPPRECTEGGSRQLTWRARRRLQRYLQRHGDEA